MKIIMLSWEYTPHVAGGLGRHVVDLVPALVAEGVEVHLLTPVVGDGASTQTVENGAVVHRVMVQKKTSDLNIHTKATAVNRLLYDYAIEQLPADYCLIHNHDWLTGFVAQQLHQTWSCPLVTTFHATERGRGQGHVGSDLQRDIDHAEHELSHQTDEVIVCSHAMFGELQAYFGVSAEKLHIVPNGVGWSNAATSPPVNLAELRTAYAQADELLIFSIGRLVYEKGIHVLVQAMPLVLAEYPHARLVIAGRGPEGENLKEQVQTLHIADHVDFVGFVSDEERDKIFLMAQCAVFPSLYEPFGIVALEAMAHGCPVVVSQVGGLAEVVVHGQTGLTALPNDAHAVAAQIVEIFRQPEMAQQYVQQAYRAIQEEFNWPRIAKLTQAVYHRVCAKSS